ncbi:MAG: TIGR03749 family integrating conjugative element protein [Nitrospiraceae bacterium]
MALPSTSHALEILRWERLPLAIPLVVGHERVVFIDRNVRVGVPASVGERLRVQSAGGAIYMRASEPIDPTRVQLHDADTGSVILLDISARAGDTPLEPVRIVDSTAAAKRNNDGTAEAILTNTQHPGKETPVAVALTRYAAQSLYAPLRTVESVDGIARVNLRGNPELSTLLPTLPLRAKALGAWRLEDQWVTAVRLTNTSSQWVDLDPRVLQGDFIAATFQHAHLGPAGDSRDTTVVYLITRTRGLDQSLLPTISPIDASVNLPTTLAASDEDHQDKK